MGRRPTRCLIVSLEGGRRNNTLSGHLLGERRWRETAGRFAMARQPFLDLAESVEGSPGLSRKRGFKP